MPPKTKVRHRDETGNALARRAREAEAAFRASSPYAAAVPPEEPSDTRRQREARLMFHASTSDEAAEAAAVQLQRMRAVEATSERLRAGRKRPHKHLPAGLDRWPYVLDAAGKVKLVPYGDEHTGQYVSIRRGARTVDGWEPVTRALAKSARQLRSVCDLEARTPRRLGGEWAKMDDDMKSTAERQRRDGGTWNHLHFDGAGGTLVCHEVAQAIRAAAEILTGVWASVLLEKLETARLLDEQRARDIPSASIDAFEPRAILALTICELLYVGLEIPAYVDESVVAWVRDHLAIGVSRGGGRSSMLASPQMRTLLLNRKNLAAAMASGGGKGRRPNSRPR